MPIRPLRTRTTKEDIKNFKEAMSKASTIKKPQNSIAKLSRYTLLTIGSSVFCYIITKQLFTWLAKQSSTDE
jgi:hypothetical protein